MNYTIVNNSIIINDFNILIFFMFLIFSFNMLYLKFKKCFNRINSKQNILIDISQNNLSENLIDISYNRIDEIDELPSYSDVYPSR